ncbi:uncharacterized protein LOC127836286 [Dreissena polymorpha]|nr:uncharacterized protein LOC127836286 [Dreissena polymorpha]
MRGADVGSDHTLVIAKLKLKLSRVKEKENKEIHALIDVKRHAKADKRKFNGDLATEAEDAAARQDVGTLYKITKVLVRGFTSTEVPVKNLQGEIVSTDVEKLSCWKEHFERVLNSADPSTEAVIAPAEIPLDINTEPPTMQEIRQATKKLKNGKAPGIDRIKAELLKAKEQITPTVLASILRKVWISETALADWKVGLLVKLPKKRDHTDCNNWRGIMLLSMTSKIFGRIVLDSISASVDELLRKNQAGFRKGKSCSDQIFRLGQITEQSHEWDATVIDFQKAFDSVNKLTLWRILAYYGISDKIISVIKMLYSDFSAKTPMGRRKRGRPKETWRRSVEKEMRKDNWSWVQVRTWSKDRVHWRALVEALCAHMREED